MSDIKYDPSGNSNSSFQVGADTLIFFFVVRFFYVFSCIVNTKI